jgi:hypothetical protein
MTEINQREEQVFAFDVPLDLSADEAARLMDEICPEGFYPWQTLMWPGVGMRVFCKRAKASKSGEFVEARLKAAKSVNDAKDAEDARADIALAEILAASPRISVGLARVQLGRAGFRRGHTWMADAVTRARAWRRANQ